MKEEEPGNTSSWYAPLSDKNGNLFMFDWNILTLDEMVEYLRNKYIFSSSGEAKCIHNLIDFYDKHK